MSLSTAWDTVDKMATEFMELLPNIVIGAVVFVLFIVIATVVRKVVRNFTKDKKNANLGIVLGRLAYFALIIIGLLVGVAIITPSITPAKLLSALGVGGVAIGFAFKDVFQNMLAGVLILLREPFVVGDEIISGSFQGKVEEIEMRATMIRTYDGKRVIIPNGQIYTEPVQVITAYNMVRSQYDVGIGYGDDIARAKEVALDVLTSIEGILQDPGPDVLTWELAGSSINLRLRWWTRPDRGTVVKTWDEVLHTVNDRMAAAHIDLPFPTQVVLWHDQTEESDGDRSAQREGWPAGENPPEPRSIAGALRESRAPREESASKERGSQAEQ